MPPSIVALPPRQNSMRFSDEDVRAVIELFSQCEHGQAVRLTDEPDDSENTARRRAEIMKDQIADAGGIPAGFKVRGHVLTEGDPTEKKVSGKTYKAFPKNWGAVSLVPDDSPDEPAADQPPADESPADQGGDESPADESGSRRRR